MARITKEAFDPDKHYAIRWELRDKNILVRAGMTGGNKSWLDHETYADSNALLRAIEGAGYPKRTKANLTKSDISPLTGVAPDGLYIHVWVIREGGAARDETTIKAIQRLLSKTSSPDRLAMLNTWLSEVSGTGVATGLTHNAMTPRDFIKLVSKQVFDEQMSVDAAIAAISKKLDYPLPDFEDEIRQSVQNWIDAFEIGLDDL